MVEPRQGHPSGPAGGFLGRAAVVTMIAILVLLMSWNCQVLSGGCPQGWPSGTPLNDEMSLTNRAQATELAGYLKMRRLRTK